MHILITSDLDFDLAASTCERGESIEWIVPKSALKGERCVFSHWRLGLFGYGSLESEPIKVPDRAGKYVSSIRYDSILGLRIPHSLLTKDFPEWRWPNYPMSYTTVTGNLAADLWSYVEGFESKEDPWIDGVEASEGAATLRVHQVRERDSGLIKRKKQSILAKGQPLSCEVCAFDFHRVYGRHGENFCEVHHLRPLSLRDKNESTMPEDLAVVCSNCHRMLHRHGLISVEELRGKISATT